MFDPSHPGEILQEYVSDLKTTQTNVAKGLNISRKVLSQILNGHAGISAEMAIKLSVAFNTTPEFWMNLQKNYDLWQAKQRVDTSTIKHFLKPA
jgi:addiction module HigA family antidote